jgi:hypothetical protein
MILTGVGETSSVVDPKVFRGANGVLGGISRSSRSNTTFSLCDSTGDLGIDLPRPRGLSLVDGDSSSVTRGLCVCRSPSAGLTPMLGLRLG